MRRTKAEAEETRQNILLAAERVFFEKGVANSSLEDVAAAAGVTRGAIYWHFASKTDLFLELYRSVPLPQADMLDFDELASSEGDILTCIENAACYWLVLLGGDERRQRIMTILLRTNYTEEFEVVLRAQQELDDYHSRNFGRAFSQACRLGKLDDRWTPETASQAAKWMIKGMCNEWLLFGKRFDLAGEGVKAVRQLFAGFRAPDAPR